MYSASVIVEVLSRPITLRAFFAQLCTVTSSVPKASRSRATFSRGSSAGRGFLQRPPSALAAAAAPLSPPACCSLVHSVRTLHSDVIAEMSMSTGWLGSMYLA